VRRHDLVYNHDGFGILRHLAETDMGEQAAADLLVGQFVESGITIIDWCILSTGNHNCRTRHRKGTVGGNRTEHPRSRRIRDITQHYLAQPLDLLDIVVKHGHAFGATVFGNLRLNHGNVADSCPGRTFVYDGPYGYQGSRRKDFRDEVFHAYLLEVLEDLLAKGVDGISVDFERKMPFFPSDTPREEAFAATRAFLERVRKLTGRPVMARVAHDREKGERWGQQPEVWLRAGLLDAIVPATHNHEGDPYDWTFDRFVKAAADSPRPCRVYPQIWPTWTCWKEFHDLGQDGRGEGTYYEPVAVQRRGEEILQNGADGIFFFNFCCHHEGNLPRFNAVFKSLSQAATVS
jgi:hypothetical protein